MSLISDFLFKHSEKYQKKHLLYTRLGGWSTGYFTDTNLDKIPYNNRTKELCLIAYENVDNVVKRKILKLFPCEHFEDENFCIKLLECDMKDLKSSPISGMPSLDFMPTKYASKEILTKIINIEPWFIGNLDRKNLADDELFELSYKKSNGKTFTSYPLEARTYEKCYEVASKYEGAIQSVPIQFRDQKLINAWIKNLAHKEYFKYIPKGCLNEQTYLKMVMVYPNYLGEIPEEYFEKVRNAYSEYLNNKTTKTAK